MRMRCSSDSQRKTYSLSESNTRTNNYLLGLDRVKPAFSKRAVNLYTMIRERSLYTFTSVLEKWQKQICHSFQS